MNKKIFLLGILTIVSLLNISLGASIGDISMRFCNDNKQEKTLNLQLDSEQETGICMTFSNGANEDSYININFVDGTITNDSSQKKACKNENEKEMFGQWVTRTGDKILVPAKGETTQYASIRLPSGPGGEIHGCVTYSIDEAKKSDGMFLINVRRASFIDVLLSGSIDTNIRFIRPNNKQDNLGNNEKIYANINENGDLAIEAAIENLGTVSENLIITGTIKNFLGYKKEFMIETRSVFPKQTANIIGIVEKLPFYKGRFKINYSVAHAPTVGENVNNREIMEEKTSITIMNRGANIGLLVLIAMIITIITLIKKLKKQSAPKATTTKPIAKKTVTTKTTTKKATTKKPIAKKTSKKK